MNSRTHPRQPRGAILICSVWVDYQPRSPNSILRKHWSAAMTEKKRAMKALGEALRARDYEFSSWCSHVANSMGTTFQDHSNGFETRSHLD
jgi:hypothetical protein